MPPLPFGKKQADPAKQVVAEHHARPAAFVEHSARCSVPAAWSHSARAARLDHCAMRCSRAVPHPTIRREPGHAGRAAAHDRHRLSAYAVSSRPQVRGFGCWYAVSSSKKVESWRSWGRKPCAADDQSNRLRGGRFRAGSWSRSASLSSDLRHKVRRCPFAAGPDAPLQCNLAHHVLPDPAGTRPAPGDAAHHESASVRQRVVCRHGCGGRRRARAEASRP